MSTTRRLMAVAATTIAALGLASCSAITGMPSTGNGTGEAVDPLSAPTVPGPTPTSQDPAPSSGAPTPEPTEPAAETTQADSSTGPSSAPTQAPDPTDAPASSSSPEAGPTTPPKAFGILRTTDKNKYVDSEVPFLAGIATGTELVHFYRFERMDVDWKCTNPQAGPPQNGHFVRVFYMLSNSKVPKGGPKLDVTAHTWQYTGKDGKTLDGAQLATSAAKSCQKGSKGEFGAVAEPGFLVGGEIVFDLPSTDGILQQTYREGVGGWRFPVKNANTNFRSLDERAADRFNGIG